MQNLLVYQSLWAMERRAPDGMEWTIPEKLTMIRDAGFDGCGVRFFDFAYAKEVTDFLRANKMTWQAQCYPQSVEDFKPTLSTSPSSAPITSICSPMCGPIVSKSAFPISRAGGVWRKRPALRCTSKPIAIA